MDNLQDISLYGLELEHAFLSAIGVQLLGSPGGPFAAFNVQENKLLVFGMKQDSIEMKSLDDDFALMPLDWAKRNEASFCVENGQVICRIGKVKSFGRSYSEAAMRALVTKLNLA